MCVLLVRQHIRVSCPVLPQPSTASPFSPEPLDLKHKMQRQDKHSEGIHSRRGPLEALLICSCCLCLWSSPSLAGLEQPQLSWLRQVPQLFFWFCELLIAFPSFLFLFKPGRINSCGFQTKDPNKPCGECSQRAGGTPCAFFIKTRCGLPLTATMCMA